MLSSLRGQPHESRVQTTEGGGIGYLLIGNIYTLALEPSAIDIWKSVDMIAVWILVPSAIGQTPRG